MVTPSPWPRIGRIAWIAACIAAPAPAQGLPPELEGHLQVSIERCQAGPSGLLRAIVRIETGGAEIRLPELHCGAFVPGSDEVLFLNAVDGGRRVPPHTTHRLEAHFPGDARHTECRCVVADVRRLEHGGEAWRELDDWAEDWWQSFRRAERRQYPRVFARRGPRVDPALPETEASGSGPDVDAQRRSLPLSTLPRLRREWVLRSGVVLREEPAASSEGASVALEPGQPVDVLGLSAGAKQVRIVTGETGWIDADAASPVRRAEPDLEIALDALATAGHLEDASFCRDRSDELRPLVFALLPEARTVYVTSEWFLLDERRQDAFQVWTQECYGIGRIVEVGGGQELRSYDWGDRPTLRLAADPEPGLALPATTPAN